MKKILLILTLISCFLFAEEQKVLIVSTAMAKSSQNAKLSFIKNEAKKLNLTLDYKFFDEITPRDKKDKLLQSKENKKDELRKARLSLLGQYDLVIFDSLAGTPSLKRMLDNFDDITSILKDIKILPIIKTEDNPYLKNITKEHSDLIYDYWQNGGVTNTQNMIKFIQSNILNNKNIKIDEPKILVKNGIYHPSYPDLVFNSTKEYFDYFKIDKTKPIVAISFSRNSLVSNILEPIDYVIKAIEKNGATPLAYYFKSSKEDSVGLKFLQENKKTIANSLIVFSSFIMDDGTMKKAYDKLNIPVLHGIYFRQGDQKDWENSKEGLAFGSIAMQYIVPETLGYTDSLVVAAQDKITKEIKTIPYQMDSFASKAVNLAKLRTTPNKDKKIALMYYGGGVNSIGASALNVPKTIEKLLKDFKEKGYITKVKDAAWFEKQGPKTLLAYHSKNQEEKMLNENAAELYPYDEYMKFFKKLPITLQKAINKTHKSARFSKMIVRKDGKRYFLIPRIKLGNIVLMPQPNAERVDKVKDKIKMLEDKSVSEEKEDLHNASAPISHSYLASYLYVRKQFKANAIIHLGTHGTVEWTFGKARGLSVYDSPILALGDLPHFYPYIMNNVAETLQVKRRARGVILSHQTPPFALSGTYNEISEINELVNQYEIVTKGLIQEKVKKQIIEKVVKLNIHKDMDESIEEINEDFDHFLHELEEFIEETSSLAQPIGLHVLGTSPKGKNLTTTIIQMLGKEFLQKANGNDYAKNDYKNFEKSKAYLLINDYVINNKDINTLKEKEFKFYIKEAKRFKALFENQKETINLFRALNAEHIKSGTGGGPIRNPEALPTGTNIVSFDPSKVPSKAAYQTGKTLMDNFVKEYYEKNGVYPSKITFNLWGLETVRHHGVMEAQIMAAMGVKPIWNENGVSNEFMQGMLRDFLSSYIGDSLASWISKKITLNGIEYTLNLTPDTWFVKAKRMIKQFASNGRGRVKDVEIIPYSELKRPRVDVVLSVTGLYRDTFPATMQLLAKAVKKVASLKEESNHVYLNAKALEEKLAKKGINKDEAKRLSTIRIFSNKTGTYGSGVDEVQTSGKWESDDVITKKYFKTRGYYFGDDEKKWDEQRNDINLFGDNLSGSQSVIFSRSSNLYGLLTSDDPYGLFGSLSMAIRKLDGTNPKTYISNLRDPANAKIQTTAKFMAQELRSRYFHPNWIKEMKKEGYSGTQEVSAVVSNFWGWQVVDPDIVRGDQWQEFVNVYIDDKYNLDLKKWFKKNNPQALANMTEKMVEAYRKDYWDADEKTIKKLLKLHEELEKEFKVKSFNLKFKEFKNKANNGFGLASLRQSAQMKKQTLEKPANKQIKGQKLEKQIKTVEKKSFIEYYILMFLLLILGTGLYYEYRRD